MNFGKIFKELLVIVWGSVRNGIKHVVLYAKEKFVLLQELIEYNMLELEPTLPKEKIKENIPLPKTITIREVKPYTKKEVGEWG